MDKEKLGTGPGAMMGTWQQWARINDTVSNQMINLRTNLQGIAMTLGAVLSFDSLGYALIFPAAYLSIAILEGNFVTPMVLGRSLTLNPVIILMALAFWGWMWGISGMILALPILATFKIFCDHIEPMAPIAEFMS